MKAIELQKFFQSSLPDWQYPHQTVDTIKSGDPDIQVTGIAVGWMSYKWSLEHAIELGCNVFITHEPTYYDHHDNDSEIIKMTAVEEKRQFIEDNRLVVIRCHDLWDRMERIGIADAWGEYLGFEKSIAGSEFVRVYEIESQTALRIAQHVAFRTKNFGQPAVQLIGPQDILVSKIAIGTGAITPYLELVRQFDIDLAICTDDGIKYWRDGAFAIDMGIPIIVVNHPVSEEFGVYKLAEFIQNKFPGTPVHYIQQNCMYQLVGSADNLIIIKDNAWNHN